MTPVIAGYIQVSRESVESFATLFGKQLFLTLKAKQKGQDFDVASFLSSQFVSVAEEYARSEAIRFRNSPSAISLELPHFSPLNAFGEHSAKKTRGKIPLAARIVRDESVIEQLEFSVSDLCLEQAAISRQDSSESHSSCQTTATEVARQSATIMETLEKQYFDLEREHKSYLTKLQTALSANEVLNEENAKLKSELLEVCEEKAALSVGNEKLMFEIAEKETEVVNITKQLKQLRSDYKQLKTVHPYLYGEDVSSSSSMSSF
ncbi:hypothetical protein CYMTET_37081 [Cymbomonas tetramitiformis]|uniref:Uncharacterized protein n=1 Tax=Cymbomonas tetramitiformis TaxID=36881 RepID=A0AAE0CG79_9CHLO|nr:hypothetical protein CYMTET_37081 [Cymbomonas tetramitiformis]